jgi:hypothetical protein
MRAPADLAGEEIVDDVMGLGGSGG